MKHSGYSSVNTRPITCAHAYQVRTRVYILSYLMSVPFFFFVNCRIRVRVSSMVRDSVSFIFLLHFFFPMYVNVVKKSYVILEELHFYRAACNADAV